MSRPALEQMDPEERAQFCRRVMERLSEIVEGEADPDLERQVAEVLHDCQPFHVYRDTLARTIELTRECGEAGRGGEPVDEERFRACVERVRARLEELED